MPATLPEIPASEALSDLTCLRPVPPATVRTEVDVPLRFPDGYTTTARVVTFDGLADDREHLALGLGHWTGALTRAASGGEAPLVRPHSECLTGEDERDYTAAAQMLHALGAGCIRLLSNNPDKAAQLQELGVEVTEQVRTGVHLSPANAGYLTAKVRHTAHTLDLPLAG